MIPVAWIMVMNGPAMRKVTASDAYGTYFAGIWTMKKPTVLFGSSWENV
jgi:hypothetical protein